MALCDTQCRAQFEKSICLYVGALLGVWGIIPFFVPDHVTGGHCSVCWLVVGVLCENCIVDASIKHTR